MINLKKNIITQMMDRLPLGTLIIDAGEEGWPVVYANAIVGQLLGLDADTLLGTPWASLLVDPDELVGQRQRLCANPTLAVRHLRQQWQSRSGMPVGMTLQVSPLFDGPGQPAYWLLSVDADLQNDLPDDEETLRVLLRGARQRLSQVERRDVVTGLVNRRHFTRLLQHDCALAVREERRLSVVAFEVEAFDRYRDFYGRHAADSCLRKVAHAISGSLRRNGDIAARVGGSRFAALVGAGEETQVRHFAERIALRVRELAIHHPRSPAGRYVTVAIGICSGIPLQSDTGDSLLAKAEASLLEPRSLPGQAFGA